MKSRPAKYILLTALVVSTLGAAGCRYGPYKPRPFQRILGDGLVAEYDSNRDRLTRFGPRGRFNLLYVTDLDREPSPSGQWTHFGGMYTWVAPQGAWTDENGNPLPWPPEAAMDSGPDYVFEHGLHNFKAIGPILKNGLQETKSVVLERDDFGARAVVTNGLTNTTDHSIRAGVWVTTAVIPGSVVAFLTPPGGEADLALSRHPRARETWDNITRSRSQWTLVRTKRYYWWMNDADTMKVRVPSDRVVASHRRGHWLVRIGPPVNADNPSPSIQSDGQNPVEVAVNFGSRIHEMSMVGPIVEIAPGQTITYTEYWYIIPGMASRVSQLDEALYRIDPDRFPKPSAEPEDQGELEDLENWLEEPQAPSSPGQQEPQGPIDIQQENGQEPFIEIDEPTKKP